MILSYPSNAAKRTKTDRGCRQDFFHLILKLLVGVDHEIHPNTKGIMIRHPTTPIDILMNNIIHLSFVVRIMTLLS